MADQQPQAGEPGTVAVTVDAKASKATYVILAEAVNPEHGLGYMVELARTHQKASWSFAGLLVIGGIGLLTDFVIRMISALLFRWRETTV